MIVITTPTGQIGSQVLETLLDGPEPIRVVVRDPLKLPRHVCDRIEIVVGSHGDAQVVDEAFAGADSVFWLVPPDPHADTARAAYMDFALPACSAFQRHRVKRVVGISALGRGTMLAANAGNVTASLAMDDVIAITGVSYRALTMPSFMDNLLRQVVPIRDQGVFFSPISGDLRAPSVATRDIAAIAAELLADHSWSGTGSVPVLGPEDLSFNEMAEIMSSVLGRSVHFQQITREAFKTGLVERGVSEAMAQATLDMLVAKDQGLDSAEPRTTAATTPTNFRRWCEEVLKPRIGQTQPVPHSTLTRS